MSCGRKSPKLTLFLLSLPSLYDKMSDSSKKEELQHQLQTLNVLESELKSLKPDAVSNSRVVRTASMARMGPSLIPASFSLLLTGSLEQKVYNAIPTPLEAPLISHAHGQKALFPNLDAKSALEDVQRELPPPHLASFAFDTDSQVHRLTLYLLECRPEKCTASQSQTARAMNSSEAHPLPANMMKKEPSSS